MYARRFVSCRALADFCHRHSGRQKAIVEAEVNSTMAHVVTIPIAEATTPTDGHHGLPPFAAPMLILFGMYAVWLLIVGIVLLIIR